MKKILILLGGLCITLIVSFVVYAAPTSTIVQNLFIQGLSSTGNPCLSVGSTGLISTSTCGGADGTDPFKWITSGTILRASSTFTQVWISSTASSSITGDDLGLVFGGSLQGLTMDIDGASPNYGLNLGPGGAFIGADTNSLYISPGGNIRNVIILQSGQNPYLVISGSATTTLVSNGASSTIGGSLVVMSGISTTNISSSRLYIQGIATQTSDLFQITTSTGQILYQFSSEGFASSGATSTFNAPLIVNSNVTGTSLFSITANRSYGGGTELPAEGALNIQCTGNTSLCGQFYTNEGADANSPMVLIRSDNSAFDDGILWLLQDGTAGGAYGLKITDPNPDIEFDENDQTSPLGDFEIAIQGDIFQINGRNADNSAFINQVSMERFPDGGRMSIGNVDNDPDAKLEIIATGTSSIFYINSTSSDTAATNGDILFISDNGGIAWGTSTKQSSANFFITSRQTASTTLQVNGLAGQTSNILVVASSANTTFFSVSPSGTAYFSNPPLYKRWLFPVHGGTQIATTNQNVVSSTVNYVLFEVPQDNMIIDGLTFDTGSATTTAGEVTAGIYGPTPRYDQVGSSTLVVSATTTIGTGGNVIVTVSFPSSTLSQGQYYAALTMTQDATYTRHANIRVATGAGFTFSNPTGYGPLYTSLATTTPTETASALPSIRLRFVPR